MVHEIKRIVVIKGGMVFQMSSLFHLYCFPYPPILKHIINILRYAVFLVIIGLESVVKYIATAPATSENIQNMKVA